MATKSRESKIIYAKITHDSLKIDEFGTYVGNNKNKVMPIYGSPVKSCFYIDKRVKIKSLFVKVHLVA